MEEGPGRGQLAHLSSQKSKEINSKEPGSRQTLLKQGLRDPLPPIGPPFHYSAPQQSIWK